MRFLRKPKLSVRLMCINVLVTLGCAVVVFTIFSKFLTQVKSSRTEQLRNEHALLSYKIGSQFFERYGDAQTFSLQAAQSLHSQKEAEKVLNELSHIYGIYDLILVLNTDGTVKYINTQSGAGRPLPVEVLRKTDFSTFSWFQAALKGEYTEDAKLNMKGTYVSQPFMFEPLQGLSREPSLSIVFSTQIKSESGSVKGVLANVTNFQFIEQELQHSLEHFVKKGLNRSDLILFNDSGTLLAEASSITKSDPKNRLQFNLISAEVEGSLESTKGQSGIIIGTHKSLHYPTIAAYGAITDKKFLSNLGWSLLVRLDADEVLGDLQNVTQQFFMSLWLYTFIAIIGLLLYVRNLSRGLEVASHAVWEASQKNADTSTNMSSLSSTLASASTEQAAAIQESVAALTEMTSMIHQTHENTKSALESSAKVSERSEAGRQIMGRMSASMQSIEEANQALQGIATIIQEIHQKTGVIRDIVFKTQLLSFNASIEAARAGAAGRGFSVVAEEVGNLAQMSGTSATEIEALLSKSQAQVGSALEMIHLRIKEGQVVSDEAVKTFHTIAGSVQGITQQVKSIKEASDQQNLGIDQTQKAMQQLSDAAISNSETAQKAADASKSLEALVQTLNKTSHQLAAIVHGERETQNKGPKGPTPPFTTQAKGDKGPLTADDPTFTRAS